MRIKKFVDNDMIRLMRLVKEELGENAVIISTSQLEDGRSELVAAVENDDIEFINNTPEIYDSFYNDCFIRERLVYHQTEISTQSELLALCRQQAETLHEKDDLKILSSVLVTLFASYAILRPLRDALGLEGDTVDLKWLFLATFILIILASLAAMWISSRLKRMFYINAIFIFFPTYLSSSILNSPSPLVPT